jgi:hypothetical protein
VVTTVIVVFKAIGYAPLDVPDFIDNGLDRKALDHIIAKDPDSEFMHHILVVDVFYKIICLINLLSAFIFFIPVTYLLAQ